VSVRIVEIADFTTLYPLKAEQKFIQDPHSAGSNYCTKLS